MYKEGNARIKYSANSFLNPDAVISRDLSVAFVSAVADKKAKILDSTAATGIRGIRYYLEGPSRDVTFLEMNKSAFSSMKRNIAFNKVKSNEKGISIQEFANTSVDKFDLIDLDPFGGATPYIYDLMKISRSGTHLLVSVTDAAVLCGADYKACMRLYDARPMHNELCQEVGLRLLIGYVARVAAQFNFGIGVLTSFSYLHYMRIFIRLNRGSQQAIGSIKKLGYVYYCNKCLNRGFETTAFPSTNNCKICGRPLEISGKVWLGSINDRKILMSIKAQMDKKPERYNGKSFELLDLISKELDIPLYYSVSKMTKKMKIGSVSISKLSEMLERMGYSVTRTHMSKNAIKTDANIKEIKSCIKRLSKDY